jgi:hypothetical protein
MRCKDLVSLRERPRTAPRLQFLLLFEQVGLLPGDAEL